MLHGKKGFERIVWACKNVLNQSVSWLFCDLAPTSETTTVSDKLPIDAHHPQIIDCDPTLVHHPNILVPSLEKMNASESSDEDDLRENCDSLCEWLALVALDSPRVAAHDAIDPYLSRYEVLDVEEAKPMNLISLRWHGLVSSQWIMQLFLLLL